MMKSCPNSAVALIAFAATLLALSFTSLPSPRFRLLPSENELLARVGGGGDASETETRRLLRIVDVDGDDARRVEQPEYFLGERWHDRDADRRHRSLSFFESKISYERTTLKLPEFLERNLVDWTDSPGLGSSSTAKSPQVTPVFWHILKSGGTHMKHMYATCYRFVEACETGGIMAGEDGQDLQQQLDAKLGQQIEEELMQLDQPQPQDNITHRRLQDDPPLRIIETADGRRYVDVDTTTGEGLVRASMRGLIPSGTADMVFTPLLVEGAEMLFDQEHKGLVFAMFRHPVQRVVSMFHYLKRATHEPTYHGRYAAMTIEEYVNSPFVEGNWMVRSLVRKLKGPLDVMDVEVAKEIIRRKCIVGLLHRFEESIDRFHTYFGFDDDEALGCAKMRFVKRNEHSNLNKHEHLSRKSELYNLLMEKNSFDVMLFRFVTELFEEQGKAMKAK